MLCCKSKFSCMTNLRAKCFIIAYLNLFSSIVDIGCHLLIVAIVTRSFQCDVDINSLRSINWPWLEPLLLVINLGTHGFYPFPMILSTFTPDHFEFMTNSGEPRCYPGMLHVNLIDVLNFLINAIWLRLVMSYVAAVHKKDPEQMRMFFGLSVVKLVLQVVYFSYQPDFKYNYSTEGYWFLQILDICIAAIFLLIMNSYINSLRAEKRKDQPPSYIECLINGPSQSGSKSDQIQRNNTVANVENKKLDMPSEQNV